MSTNQEIVSELQKINNKVKQNYPRTKKNRRNQSKNKVHQRCKKEFKRSYSRFASVMSNWTENFTMAATWQLKHQLAFWKAKAKALEFENTILHDIIRKRNTAGTAGTVHSESHKATDVCSSEGELSDIEMDQGNVDGHPEEDGEGGDDDEDEIVVSDEYIQFLIENEKYRQDAKREREKFRAKAEENERLAAEMDAELNRVKTKEEKEAELKELYGDKWERIQGLQTATQALFMDDSDRDKPVYWPVIPLNFG